MDPYTFLTRPRLTQKNLMLVIVYIYIYEFDEADHPQIGNWMASSSGEGDEAESQCNCDSRSYRYGKRSERRTFLRTLRFYI